MEGFCRAQRRKPLFMSNTQNDRNGPDGFALPSRRKILVTGLGLAAASLLPRVPARAQPQGGQPTNGVTSTQSSVRSTPHGRRRLGSLEVSSVGLGVQNMSRTYQTTIPTRAEMINIIRTAFDRGVT